VIKRRTSCVETVLGLWMKWLLIHRWYKTRLVHRCIPGLLPCLWTNGNQHVVPCPTPAWRRMAAVGHGATKNTIHRQKKWPVRVTGH